MQFFLHDILGRIVAACLCLDCYRTTLNGLVEKNPPLRAEPDTVSAQAGIVYKRDTEPVFYWMQIGTQADAHSFNKSLALSQNTLRSFSGDKELFKSRII